MNVDSKRKRYLIAGVVLPVVLLAAGCFWFFDLAHADVEELPGLHGKTMEEVVGELGEPDYSYDFKMDQPMPEFRVELYNTYPPDDPKTWLVKIRERQWRRCRYSIAVWFHQVDGRWVALDTCRWKKDVVF